MTALTTRLTAESQSITTEFPGRIKAETVDLSFAEAYKSGDCDSLSQMTFDFSSTTFIEPVALQMVIAAMLDLKQSGCSLALRIPKDRRVRDFWRAWGFPQAINAALEPNAFHRMTHADDQFYFGERQLSYLPATLPAHPGFAAESVRSSNFFGFHTLTIDPTSKSTRFAYEEKDSWNVAHIQAVLSAQLGRGSTYFPSRVAFEAVLNALRHPDAHVVQTASLESGGKKRGDFFVTHFWDDGLSMAKTLAAAINAQKEFRGEVEPDFDRKYLLIESRDDDPDSIISTIESGKIELERGLDLSRALFATILPGVTSDPTGPGHDVPDEILVEDARFGRRGMGLYILINAVVEVLGGNVSFRAGRHFMYVRKTNQKEYKETGAAIRVRVKERPAHLPEFRGNLVTIRARLPQDG